MCCPMCVKQARPSCCLAQLCGLLAGYDPSKNSKYSMCDQMSVRPSIFDRILLKIANSTTIIDNCLRAF